MKRETELSPNEILEEKIDKLHRKKEWKRLLAECVIIVAAVFLIFQYVIGIAFVSGDSMSPTLEDGEMVVFYRLDSAYRKNDIVVMRGDDGEESIKRAGDLSEDTEKTEEIAGRVFLHIGMIE